MGLSNVTNFDPSFCVPLNCKAYPLRVRKEGEPKLVLLENSF